MREWIWIIVLVASVILLFITAVKSKTVRDRLRWVLINMAVAALLLYVINVVGIVDGLYVPINSFTMVVAALLGFPGLLALVAVTMWVL